MPEFRNLSAWIQIDGQKLAEFGARSSGDGSKTEISCWIPSEVGKKFEICYQDRLRATGTITDVYVDGTRCGGRNMHSYHSKPNRPDTATMTGVQISKDRFRCFTFARRELTDDESIITPSLGLGEIKMCVHEVRFGEKKHGSQKSWAKPSGSMKINERSKKGIVHGVQFDQEIYRQAGAARKYTKVRTLVTFVFRYRPTAVLQADGIMPLPTKQEPLNSGDIIDLTLEDDDDAKGDLRRIRALKDELSKLETRSSGTKRKRGDSPSDVKSETKNERSINFDDHVIDIE